MLRKDFLQRKIEEFGKVMAGILLLRKKKEWDAFDQALEEACKKYSGMELEQLLQLPLEQFQQTLQEAGLKEADRIKILGISLFEKMISYEERGEEDKADLCACKSHYLLKIYMEELLENEFDLDAHYKLEHLKQRLQS